MFVSIFSLAMTSPGRQRALLRALVAHAIVLLAAVKVVDLWGTREHNFRGQEFLGQLLLVAAIVEGAFLVGWRLTQIPKSQALEFLLVTPQLPWRVFMAEAVVGLVRLALVTLAGLPVLVLLAFNGHIYLTDIPVLLVMPFTWGAITGLGLTTWAYEPLLMRRLGERLVLLGIIVYLGIGVLAAERLPNWLDSLPTTPLLRNPVAEWLRLDALQEDKEDLTLKLLILFLFRAFHELNPFGVMHGWMRAGVSPLDAADRMIGVEIAALFALGLLLVRSASRLKGHFHERHYSPARDPTSSKRGTIGERPLSWWAVRRVTEYSGRANIWLAGGFGFLYAAYTVAGPNWPPWLGKMVFVIFDTGMGGIPGVTTALVVLAAVPAAFQYGLWDSNAQDRCRRLELLLLTDLEARDYWNAAAAAAWHRGQGYFWVSVLLWAAAVAAGNVDFVQLAAALVAAVVLWGLYFALGFRAFSRGLQANGLGSLLTLGLPFLAFALFQGGFPALAGLVPPGSVYNAVGLPSSLVWVLGPILGGTVALVVARHALTYCDAELRRWYDLNHGQKAME